MIETLTQLGGAKGWQDLLESGRLGVRENEARMWHCIIRNVRDMADPEYAVMHGAAKTAYLAEEDIARLSDALASRLAEALRVTPDSDASLTLIAVMNGQRDLCAKYFVLVPNGLRDQTNRDQTNVELARVLAAIKQGQSPDTADAFLVHGQGGHHPPGAGARTRCRQMGIVGGLRSGAVAAWRRAARSIATGYATTGCTYVGGSCDCSAARALIAELDGRYRPPKDSAGRIHAGGIARRPESAPDGNIDTQPAGIGRNRAD